VEVLDPRERGWVAQVRTVLAAEVRSSRRSVVVILDEVERRLKEAAPDLEALAVEGITAQTAGGPGQPMVTGTAPTVIQLPLLPSQPAPAPPAPVDDQGARRAASQAATS